MPEYKAPLRDMRFVLNEVLNSDQLFSNLGMEDATPDMVDAIMEEAAKFTEQVLSPLNQLGDEQGCIWSEEGVKTPDGFPDAYQQYVEGGWPAMTAPVDQGGQGLPGTLGIVLSEMMGTANWSWGMYPGLSRGAVRTIAEHGSDEQKETYLGKLTSGEWTGTMCLTESHCGSDLGMLRSKAEPNADGSYSISGTKIFISAGEHDMAENIVHIVLARLPDAPAGTKGISLFIVPKFNVNADSSIGERNAVHCGSIEKKMGIKASATCVMNFDGAKGFLIGPENRGLNCMFTFMNTARVGTALQGLASSEAAFQGSLSYARERLQMRALTGPVNADGPADPIIVHPDVRRMLLTQKAFTEGGRALCYWLGQLVDITEFSKDEAERKGADDLLHVLTPIAKAFLTETSSETTNMGMQVYGGHGYIHEWGMEQIVRDARIGAIYEGTTGIQAIDLLGRKVLGSGGELLMNFTKLMHKFCKSHEGDDAMAEFTKPLNDVNKEWGDLTMTIGAAAMENPNEAGAASVDYLMYSGYVVLGYCWAQMAAAAQKALKDGTGEEEFYKTKLHTARFFFQRLFPRTRAHVEAMKSGSSNLMDIDEANFAF